jgi:hypothetical protein
MSKAHERVVEAQFGPRAKAYVESAVHSQGPTSRRSQRWRTTPNWPSISARAGAMSPMLSRATPDGS